MLSIFIKIQEEYFIWDMKEKCPSTNGMNEVDLRYWISEQEKQDGIDSFENRIIRAKKTGVSQIGITIDDFLKGNCAGENGKELTKEEIYEQYNYLSDINTKTLYPAKVSKEKLDIISLPLVHINDQWRIGNVPVVGFMIFAIFTVLLLFLGEHAHFIPDFHKNKILGVIQIIKPYLLNIDVFLLGIILSAKMRIWQKK